MSYRPFAYHFEGPAWVPWAYMASGALLLFTYQRLARNLRRG